MTENRMISSEESVFISSIFSDETESFRTPCEPDPGQKVRIRLRTASDDRARAFLIANDAAILMKRVKRDGFFDIYEAFLTCGEEPVSYRFLIEKGDKKYICRRFGAGYAEDEDSGLDFGFVPGFHTPDWAKGALQYQIFTDRFCNGDSSNDVTDSEYDYIKEPVRKIKDWYAPPAEDDYRCFYGGDLAGVLEKLDYLESLGIEAIYFNPLFLSPSCHKYDAQDYEHIDPHFGVICDKNAPPPEKGERYVSRAMSEDNLEKSDLLFAELCRQIHRRGMRIILDGVFNHCGSYHRWMDAEGLYARAGNAKPGASQSPDSPYRGYFSFSDDSLTSYEGWWGHPTLPKLNYEGSDELCEKITDIACRWAKPPYSIDGWRLDVAADLGHSEQFNHIFWRRFRERLKAVNPDIAIIAEHYGDPGLWLRGDQWDSVMNYDAFMEPLTFFLTGMEKHSDYFRNDLYQDGEKFFESMHRCMARFEWTSLLCAMNQLSNHDHSRFLTRTNRKPGRTGTLGADAAGEGIDKRVFKEAVAVQMTFPGAPTIYYGDEAGQVGWTDPDNRRTYPWGREDRDLTETHRALSALRKRCPALRSGSYKKIDAGYGYIAYARFDDSDLLITVCNNTDDVMPRQLDLVALGVNDGQIFDAVYFSQGGTPFGEDAQSGEVKDGKLDLVLPARAAAVLALKK